MSVWRLTIVPEDVIHLFNKKTGQFCWPEWDKHFHWEEPPCLRKTTAAKHSENRVHRVEYSSLLQATGESLEFPGAYVRPLAKEQKQNQKNLPPHSLVLESPGKKQEWLGMFSETKEEAGTFTLKTWSLNVNLCEPKTLDGFARKGKEMEKVHYKQCVVLLLFGETSV